MEEIADLLARILLETAIVYNNTSQSYKEGRIALLDIMDEACRQYCNLIVVKQISRKARERMKEMKLDPLQLHRLKWSNQSEIDPGPKKNSIFCNEHPYSVRRLCLDTTELQPLDIETVRKHVQKMKDVWVLRTEDIDLTKLGYRSRGANWPECYKDAKIELVWPTDP